MIRPIQKSDNVYDESVKDYGLTKFIGKNGDGHRGVIIGLSEDKTMATIYGLTGEYYGKIVEVKEKNPKQWPEVYIK